MRLSLPIVVALAGCGSAAPPSPAPPQNTSPPARAEATPASTFAWQRDETAAFDLARRTHRGVMVHFTATWCMPCTELEKVMATPEVATSIAERFVPLMADVTDDDDATGRALREKYVIATLPAVVFVTTDGKVVGRITELVDAAGLTAAIAAAR